MTILHRSLQSGEGHAARGWHGFGDGDQAVRVTEAWEHETFAEEQARWEREDLEYARICEQVRRARERGGEASRRADEAKAEWDARVAAQRQANDDAQRAQHALRADQTAGRRPAASRTTAGSGTEAPFRKEDSGAGLGDPRSLRSRPMHTTFAIESSDSRAPGIMPEPVRVHDEPAAATAPRGERQAARRHVRGPATRNPVRNEPTQLEVE